MKALVACVRNHFSSFRVKCNHSLRYSPPNIIIRTDNCKPQAVIGGETKKSNGNTQIASRERQEAEIRVKESDRVSRWPASATTVDLLIVRDRLEFLANMLQPSEWKWL